MRGVRENQIFAPKKGKNYKNFGENCVKCNVKRV